MSFNEDLLRRVRDTLSPQDRALIGIRPADDPCS